MPLYEYECACGKRYEAIKPIAEHAAPIECYCGRSAKRILSPAMVHRDLPGYECPITGRRIEGRKAHEENLRRHQCRVLESGEMEDVRRNKASEEKQLDRDIENTVGSMVEKMPPRKQEALANELQRGADLTVVRQ